LSKRFQFAASAANQQQNLPEELRRRFNNEALFRSKPIVLAW